MNTPYNMHKVLVTGGAGFIGSHFVNYLLNDDPNVQIINVDKLTYAGQLNNLGNLKYPERHQFIKGDIADRSLIAELLSTYEIDTIVHFAAETHVDRSITEPTAFIESNIIGTFTLLEAARKYWLEQKKLPANHHRFHHISTDEVYGSLHTTDPAFTEKTAYAPNSPYSASKASSDHLVRAYHHTYHLSTTTSNCSNNYGPYQHAEKFIPTIIQCCLNKQTIPIYGDGTNIRDWLHVQDHCSGISAIIRHGQLGQTYNIGSNNEQTNLQIVNKICTLLDQLLPNKDSYKNLIKFVSDRPGHDQRYAINTKKINQELNWHAKIAFEQGLIETIRWYLSQ